MNDKITFVLPSKGVIADPTRDFLDKCGLHVHKSNPRQYTGSIPAIPTISVLFQRVKDVVYKVADGTAQIGITGLDVVREYPHDNLIVIHGNLDYGHCKLMVAVPEAWVDVESMADLVDVALDFREEKHSNLRVATTFANLTRQFLHANGVHHFTLVKAEGAIEAAPTIGYADIITDLIQTGTTLRENHLKTFRGGIIVESQACLIGNRLALQNNPLLMETVRVLLEHIDSALYGKQYSQLTVNIPGEDAEAVGRRVIGNPVTTGLLGPTIAPVYSPNDNDDRRQWFSITITIRTKNMLEAVEYLRAIGSTQIVVVPVNNVFLKDSPTFARLIGQLSQAQPVDPD